MYPLLNDRQISALKVAISALQAQEVKQEAKHSTESSSPQKALDTISRQAAIDAVDSEIVSTNPEHFKSSEKFIKFMDDADIASFGKWQWANGFNTAVVAAKIQLEKLPSAQPEIIRCKDCKHYDGRPCGIVDWYNTADDFCSRAERRSDG